MNWTFVIWFEAIVLLDLETLYRKLEEYFLK